MTTTNGNGVVLRGGSAPTRDRALGSSPLTIRIYRVVVEAGWPMTAEQIYEQIKEVPGFHTDTALWWQRRTSSSGGNRMFDPAEHGLERVRKRVHKLAVTGVLTSNGAKGGQQRALYSPGRAPKGFRHRTPPYGWYDIDIAGQQERLTDHLALVAFLQGARAELDKGKAPARVRLLLTEAVRLLEKVSFQ
jgi:hypothetical protein